MRFLADAALAPFGPRGGFRDRPSFARIRFFSGAHEPLWRDPDVFDLCVFSFSNLPFYGSTGNNPSQYPVFAIASSTTN
ncbi:MAG: hypothetical protein GY698_13535 [Actinomycetia bacterium]|nr:hypothetical protein [Actinomycetes bacterium]